MVQHPSPLPPLRPPSPGHLNLEIENLRVLEVLGKGAMGTVFLVHDTLTDPIVNSPFALKVVEKASPSAKPDADRRARWEMNVLSLLKNPKPHPFLPHLIGSFESDDFLGWAIPYCPGGDLNVLRYHQNDRVFSQAVIRFYIAEIVCALEHLHSHGIAYRDLKPENVLIQQSGHVTLTDFDLSRQFKRKKQAKDFFIIPHDNGQAMPERKVPHRKSFSRFIDMVSETKGLKKAKSSRVSPVSRRKPSFSDGGERSNSFVGTEEYVAPEIVRGVGHEFAVDWWALGVLTYEMLYGTTPFRGKNRKETFRNVLFKPPEFIGQRTALTDLIQRLLAKDPTKRLGYYNGASEVKGHVFFQGVRWDLLTEVVRPPFIPSREEDSYDDLLRVKPKGGGGGGLGIKEYFHRLRQPPSIPPSPSPVCQRSLSLTEF